VVESFCGHAYFDPMMPLTKNFTNPIRGYSDMDLQQVSTKPATINKLIHFSKINANNLFF
jgi:hypothetical protein